MQDHFSSRADAYAQFRPEYPPEIFAFVASLASRPGTVWDCGTGSGQAAIGLARHFARVIGTDISFAQLSRARPHRNIVYFAAAAEACCLRDRSVDAAVSAQALHWFDIERFYMEVNRVVRDGGAVTVWTYGDPQMDDARLQSAVDRFNYETLADYWPAKRHLVRNGYQDLPFPFSEVPAPALTLERHLTLGAFAGYLRSWSGVAEFQRRNEVDAVSTFLPELQSAWGDPDRTRLVRAELRTRAGRVG